jgi:hypothetical protein
MNHFSVLDAQSLEDKLAQVASNEFDDLYATPNPLDSDRLTQVEFEAWLYSIGLANKG